MEVLEDRTLLAAAFPEFVDPNPADGNDFGDTIVVLSTGNVVITSPGDDTSGGIDAGAVYLFDGEDGSLISSLFGVNDFDRIGSNGVTALENGNYVIISTSWDRGAASNVGAVTFGDGVSGVSGFVSDANSLVGISSNDFVGSFGVTALANGNYVVNSPSWDNGATQNVGAVTFGDGTNGVSGFVSAANSLVGTTTFDEVGSFGVTALVNGNYVVRSAFWDNGTVTDAGAVTFGNGTNGISGAVSDTNSLVGTSNSDNVGLLSATALATGNYVVSSPNWTNGTGTRLGAVTLGDGLGGTSGAVTAANSLVGTTANDSVGLEGVTALANGNYVVKSPNWDNGAAIDAGAVTFVDGSVGLLGAVSAANSLVGTTTNDLVGLSGVTALTNGNYVVRSISWSNGAASNAGAVTFGDGTNGISGAVSAANSLVGTTADSFVGGGGVTALTNGNYVVASALWDNGSVMNVGAVTFGDGLTGVSGTVSAVNSLVGTVAEDRIGINGVQTLTNGNYVVGSSRWNNGATIDAGAVTFGDGMNGISGAVSAANSLVGTTTEDFVGDEGVTALTNGNYVVISRDWDNGATENAGAVTFADGTTGISGAVSAANSLVGTMPFDNVGRNGVTALANGNYVVISTRWDNGAAEDAGAVTFGNGMTGISGPVSTANSLVGTTSDDLIGSAGVEALSNGNYVVASRSWDNGMLTNAGAVTFGDGTNGVNGEINSLNSVFGLEANTILQDVVVDDVNGNFFGPFLKEGGGIVRVGSQTSGFVDPATITIDDVTQDEDSGAMTFTLFLSGPVDTDVTVDFAVANDTTDGSDYTTTSGTATIPLGMTFGTFTIDVTTDSIVELNEQFFVNLSNVQASGRDVTITDSQGIGTITNDDTATISIDDVTQNEDAGTMTFTVSLSGEVDTDVTVDFATANDTADGNDFTANSDAVTITAGMTSTTFTVDITADEITELDEQFFVDLSNVQASGRDVTFADSQGIGTITNDDTATISIDDVIQDEDAGTMTFTVSLSGPVDTDVTVDFATANDTADGNDFAANSGTAMIAAGMTSATLTVDITADDITELDEQFFVDLSNVQANGRDVTIADDQGSGTITNDDAATISIGDVTVIERTAASQLVTFTVTLTNEVATSVMVDFSTADDSATVNAGDYIATSGTLEFSGMDGETQTLTVEVFGDIDFEEDETFLVNLANVQASGLNVTLADASATGTIINDDLTADLAAFEEQPVSPIQINGDFELLASGNFDGTPTASDVQNDLFFSNPTTGANRIVFADGSIQNNPLDPTAINGGAYPEMLVGDFDENGSSDLFFWNPTTGENRLVHFTGGTGNVGTSFETNVVPPTAINGNDFPAAVVGNFDGAGPDDIFFWNSANGRNRLMHFETVTVGSNTVLNNFQTDVVDMTEINGNDFQEVYVGQFVDGGSDELFFLNLTTGANRRIEFSTITPGIESGVASITTGNPASQSIFNDSDDRMVQVVDLNGDGLDDVFLWDPTTGNDRTALTDFGPQALPQLVDNVVDPTIINGNDFEQLARLVDSAFTAGEAEDLYFWDATTGNNRRVQL